MSFPALSRSLLLYLQFVVLCSAFPEQGKWAITLNQTENYWGIYKSLFANSSIYVDIKCKSNSEMNVKVNWLMRESKCWEEYTQLDFLDYNERKVAWQRYYESPGSKFYEIDNYPDPSIYTPAQPYIHRCDSSISLPEYAVKNDGSVMDNKTATAERAPQKPAESVVRYTKDPIFTVPSDGVYIMILRISQDPEVIAPNTINFEALVSVEMKSPHGYLSAADYPLLHFYGGMCLIYVVFGLSWLVMSFCQWRDLLRLQFWIGGVIFLGMLEMAMFYAEYQSINSTGISVAGAVLFAEIVSAAKRTVARMLIVIVSVGFGIVKPRLGSTLHKLVAVGAIYFMLASTEATLRVFHPVNGPSSKAVMAGIPLSILDAVICWWIFQSLLSTTRTLRLRRNLVKLALYRDFTNTLIFTVIASVAFMIWSIKFLKTPVCLQEWKDIWIDEAFWHVQFCLILLVIMILFRPTNNNARYSFSPLVDLLDDDEDELVVNEAFARNMKLRTKEGTGEKKKHRNHNDIDDDLKWMQENMPADFGEGDLPALDSEDELISTKFELSKMQ